jgi:hypothetical protein
MLSGGMQQRVGFPHRRLEEIIPTAKNDFYEKLAARPDGVSGSLQTKTLRYLLPRKTAEFYKPKLCATSCSKRVNVAGKLFRRRHEGDGVGEPAQTAAADGQTSVVVVVTEPGFPTPHGERGAGF